MSRRRGAAWIIAFWLRFNLDIPGEYSALMLDLLPWVLAIHAVAFLVFGLYRGLWRYASVSDLQRIVLAVGTAALAVPAMLTFARLAFPVPRTVVYVLTPLLLVLAMSGSRLAYRAWREGRLVPLVTHPQATPVLVLGAGNAAAGLIRDLDTSGLGKPPAQRGEQRRGADEIADVVPPHDENPHSARLPPQASRTPTVPQ